MGQLLLLNRDSLPWPWRSYSDDNSKLCTLTLLGNSSLLSPTQFASDAIRCTWRLTNSKIIFLRNTHPEFFPIRKLSLQHYTCITLILSQFHAKTIVSTLLMYVNPTLLLPEITILWHNQSSQSSMFKLGSTDALFGITESYILYSNLEDIGI